MRIRDDIQGLKTGTRELRNFGLLVGTVFSALGWWFWFRGKAWYPWLLAPGLALMVAGLIVPRGLRQLYLAWMTLAIVLGFVMAHVILTLFFFLVITPVGWLSRLVGKDFLRARLDPNAQSYWIRRPKRRERQDYEQQF